MKHFNISNTHTHLHFQSLLLAIITVCLFSLQYGCESDPLNDPRETFRYGDATVTTHAGMLEFENRADFQTVMEGIHAKRFTPEDNGVHFRSMQQIINEIPAETLEVMDESLVAEQFSRIYTIVQEGEDKFLRPVVDSRALRSLVNPEGNLAIGDTVYHFTYDKTYALAKNQFTSTESIPQVAEQAYDVIRRSGNSAGVRGVIDCEKYYGGNKRKEQRKMRGELWDYNNTVYQEVSVGVENFDKNFAHIWKKDDATNIWLIGHFEVQFLDSYQGWLSFDDDLNEHGFHESEIEIVVLSRYFDGNSIANVSWDGTDMLFKTDESDDSEVEDDFYTAQCTIVE